MNITDCYRAYGACFANVTVTDEAVYSLWTDRRVFNLYDLSYKI